MSLNVLPLMQFFEIADIMFMVNSLKNQSHRFNINKYVSIQNRGSSLFRYMFGRMYVILYFDPPYFCVRSAFDPVPNFTKQNPPV